MNRPGIERDDLVTLALAAALVPLTWWLLLGWSWPCSLAGHDELAQNLLIIRELVAAGGDWTSLVYRPDLLAGFKGRDALGPFPPFALLAALGLSPTGVSVAAAFFVQTLVGFLGWRAAMALGAVWGVERRWSLVERAGTVWLCAFAPALGWRLGLGHLNLVAGLLPFLASLALLAAAAARRVSATLVAVATLALASGLLYSGQQIVVYSAVFGAPLLLGAWISAGGKWRGLGLPLLTLAAAGFIALPGFWGMLAHARSSDAPRTLGAIAVTYDFVTSSAGDWLTSLPWTRASLPGARTASLHHEVNYAVGPLLVLLALVPWRRARALALGLAFSLLAILAFSMDLAPLSRALLALVPPLRSFRVPARAILPWLSLLPVLVAAALVSQDRQASPAPESAEGKQARSRRKTARSSQSVARRSNAPALLLVSAALALLLFVVPTVFREVVLWLLALIVVTLHWRRPRSLPAAAILLLLGVASVAAFRERVPAFQDPRPLIAEAEQIGEALRRAQPELDSSLARVRLDLEIPAFTVNTAFAAGLSSLDGYEVPTRRFSTLVFALRGARHEPTAVFFKLPAQDPAFPALRQLFHVGWSASLASRGRLTLAPLGPTAGAAWFSGSVARVPDSESLVRELRAAGEHLHQRAREVLWLVDSDLLVRRDISSPPAGSCGTARVVRVDAPRRAQEITATVETPAPCPLTFAMAFTEDLRATATRTNGERVALPAFPGYGALASLVVPEGTREIRLRAVPPRVPWPAAWTAVGIALALAAAWRAWRQQAVSSARD